MNCFNESKKHLLKQKSNKFKTKNQNKQKRIFFFTDAKKKMQHNYCNNDDCAEFTTENLEVCELHANLKILDFDESSKAWMQNKIKCKSNFQYRCGVLKRNGQFCKCRIYKNQTDKKENNFCRGHTKKTK